jgi:hypothetical protein
VPCGVNRGNVERRGGDEGVRQEEKPRRRRGRWGIKWERESEWDFNERVMGKKEWDFLWPGGVVICVAFEFLINSVVSNFPSTLHCLIKMFV